MGTSFKSADYERFIPQGHAVPLSAQFSGFTDVKVEHNKKIRGLSGQDHQIDAYWEHRVAIDCKNYNRRVEKGHVQAMMGVPGNVPGLRGVLVTSRGFQKGARKRANASSCQRSDSQPDTVSPLLQRLSGAPGVVVRATGRLAGQRQRPHRDLTRSQGS